MVSKILISKGIEKIGVDAHFLNAMKYTRYHRPYIDEDVDFNVSHSGNYVLCAIGRDVQLGVDIEEIKPVDFADFIPVMTAEEWTLISQATHPLREFYRYWTMKESVFKANGLGVNNNFHAVIFDGDFVWLRGQKWHLRPLDIAPNYAAHLACNIYTPALNIEHVII